jgi:hypothetical protein
MEREGSIDCSLKKEDRKMSRNSTCMRLLCTTGLVVLLAAVPGARPGSAQGVNDMVRTLNNVLNPSDAQRLEDQARRNARPQEERYWHDYRAGLESPDRNRGRGDYRNPRDEGYRSDSGYRSDYRDQRDYRDPRDYRYDQR